MERAKAPIRVIDLPGVRKLEDQLLLYGETPELAQTIDQVSQNLFGITSRDLEFEWPDEDEFWSLSRSEQDRWSELCDQYEESFETHDNLTDDEVMEILRRFGLDFTDDRGQPLRCTKLLSGVAEAAAKGIKGKMPDSTAQWENTLARDRDAFLAKKRKR